MIKGTVYPKDSKPYYRTYFNPRICSLQKAQSFSPRWRRSCPQERGKPGQGGQQGQGRGGSLQVEVKVIKSITEIGPRPEDKNVSGSLIKGWLQRMNYVHCLNKFVLGYWLINGFLLIFIRIFFYLFKDISHVFTKKILKCIEQYNLTLVHGFTLLCCTSFFCNLSNML